jgi:serine/threonine protein kinase/class 3 adenylate cyclase
MAHNRTRMHGRVIAEKYELQRELGRGGMGTVWAALDRTLNRVVALKLMRPEHSQSLDSRRRFEREAKALAKIPNDHIVSVYEYGVFEETPYIAMELLQGEDLETRLRRVGRLSPHATLAILKQVGKALTAAAGVGVVHRDLKPSNIFIECNATGELLKILDFGVAWMLTDTADASGHGKLLGTPVYMSPEQIRGHSAHHASDLWSLAVIAYRALTGRLPFQGKSVADVIVSICTDRCLPPSSIVSDLPPGLDDFFEVTLAKHRDARWQSVRELIQAFERHCRAHETTTILVVDDEVSVHELMKMRYRKQLDAGIYDLHFARSGIEALDKLSRTPSIDVVLADINMPEMDGLTLLGRIPEVAPFAKTVMVTAYDDMNNIRRAMNHGAFDFLVKPIRFTDLDATITKTAALVRERRMLASSDGQNRLLRKLTNSIVVARLSDQDPNVVLANERCEATVIHVAIADPMRVDDGIPPAEVVRTINAIFEVVIPLIVEDGGNVDTLQGTGLLAVFHGPMHLVRALRSCTRMSLEIEALTRLAGVGSPYGQGLKIGVSSGAVVSACLGSHVCGRLSYTATGEPVDNAKRLSALALPQEILACGSLVHANVFEFQLEAIAERSEPRFGPLYRVVGGEESQRTALAPTLTVLSTASAGQSG